MPSFLGKSVRDAIEMAQENGLDLDRWQRTGAGTIPPVSCAVRLITCASDLEVEAGG